MAANFFDKIVNFVGLSPEEEEHIAETVPTVRERRRGAFLSVHTNNNICSKVVVFHPTTFEDVQKLADALKSRDAVIVNFEGIEEHLTRRIVDFLNGVTYVLGGETQKIGQAVMIFAPPNFDISKDLCYTMPHIYSRKHNLDFFEEK
jgi:cell division inhibitor SepF